MKNPVIASFWISLNGAIYGIFIGFWMMVLSNFLSGSTTIVLPSRPSWTSQFDSLATAFVVSALLWMIMGAMFALSSYWIFTKNPLDWGITQATAAHFLITWAGSTIIAFATGWLSVSLVNALTFFVEFAIVYVIIWGISILISRRRAQDLNKELHR